MYIVNKLQCGGFDFVNILSKTGLGDYSYDGAQPHAVTGVENEDYVIASSAQTVAYNPWGKVSGISEGAYTEELLYGPDGQRWKTVDRHNGQLTGLHYPHLNYEWRSDVGTLRQFHYLENGILAFKLNDNGCWYYRILTDNVGSVVRIIDGEGGTAFECSYDAWGKPTVTVDNLAFPRGYGGHEMLTLYRLVNMDGRMYDYTLGRFLSPDDYVQAPDDSQSFNRYSYCLNNPLKYSDPTGELFGIDDYIFFSAIAGGLINWGMNGFLPGWKGVASFFAGAATSVLSSMAGNYMTSTFNTAGIFTGGGVGALSGGIIGAGSNTLLGGVNNWINGKSFFDGLGKTALSGLVVRIPPEPKPF